MSNMDYEEKLEELTSGSNWINGRNETVVTVLFVTNTNVSPKFAAANPPQVVFLTQRGDVISVTIEKFLRAHEFYNVQAELTEVLDFIRAGDFIAAQESVDMLNADKEENGQQGDLDDVNDNDAEQLVYSASLAKEIDIEFMTVNGDPRREPLMTDEYLKPLLQKVSASPIVVHSENGLAMAGYDYTLTFQNTDPELEGLIHSAFDPESVCKHYAGFVWNGKLVEIDTVLGLTHEQTRAGSVLNLHLASLIDHEDAEAEDEVMVEAEPEPQPKTFAEMAAQLERERLAAAQEKSAAEPKLEAETESSSDQIPEQEQKPDSAGNGDQDSGGLQVTVS